MARGTFVALLALAAAFAIACGSDAAPTPTPTPTATPVTDQTAFLEEVDGKVEDIRDVTGAPSVPYRFVTAEEMQQFLLEGLDDPETLDSIQQAEIEYKLLGLIPQDADLYELYTELLGSQVVGAYDPDKEEFVVLQTDSGFGPTQEYTYAHEYVHRLQDWKFDLDALTDAASDNDDLSLALTALVEGDAVSVQQIYAVQNFDFADLAQILVEAGPAAQAAESAPFILRRGLEFPYVEGATFVDRLIREGGFAGVDSAFGDPPGSTEQVLHPDKYVEREDPITVTMPDALFGEGWDTINSNVLGEFFLKAWLQALGATEADAAAAAAGWGGDAYTVADNGDGQYAFAMKAVWDDPETDAAEFFTAFSSVLEASEEFTRVNVGADLGVQVFDGPGGTLALGNIATQDSGTVSIVTIAPDLPTAMTSLLGSAS